MENVTSEMISRCYNTHCTSAAGTKSPLRAGPFGCEHRDGIFGCCKEYRKLQEHFSARKKAHARVSSLNVGVGFFRAHSFQGHPGLRGSILI